MQIRELIFYRQYFHEFFDQQTEKVKEKIDYVLLNGFQKKKQKTSKGEIELAVKLMNEYFDNK